MAIKTITTTKATRMPDQLDQPDQRARPDQRGRRLWIVGSIAVAVLLGGGLAAGFVWGHHAGSDSADTVGAVSHRASATVHDAADVRFAQMMLPHHQQAIAMVAMVNSRTDSAAVRTLAAQIGSAQTPEIDTMQSWLSAWGGTVDTDRMTGMMSDAEMTQLGTLSGSDFDRAWLTMMIQHHQGAVTMARTELSDGENADALGLAASIEVTQAAQVAQMRDLLS